MKEAEREIMDGLRSFIKNDSHRAVDVGRLCEGIRPFKVQKPPRGGHQRRST